MLVSSCPDRQERFHHVLMSALVNAFYEYIYVGIHSDNINNLLRKIISDKTEIILFIRCIFLLNTDLAVSSYLKWIIDHYC